MLLEHDLKNMGEYEYDSSSNLIEFDYEDYSVTALFDEDYEDLFYKVFIFKDSTLVYENHYGKETHDQNEIDDETVEDIIDLMNEYAYECMNEDLSESEVNILNKLRFANDTKTGATFVIGKGDTINLKSDEVRTILNFYNKLDSSKKNKYLEMLTKNKISFNLAYKEAMKD
jgi:hypothetical protein